MLWLCGLVVVQCLVAYPAFGIDGDALRCAGMKPGSARTCASASLQSVDPDGSMLFSVAVQLAAACSEYVSVFQNLTLDEDIRVRGGMGVHSFQQGLLSDVIAVWQCFASRALLICGVPGKK